MKRVVMVHGWYGHPTDGWWPWLRHELEKLGYQTVAPQMPDIETPTITAWVSELSKAIGELDNDTYLVGHSLGCITILRYLESLGTSNTRAGGTILVAGFTEDLSFNGYDGTLANFFTNPINWSAIKEHCGKFWVISSDNDPTVSMVNHQRLVEALDAHETWEHNKKHMTGDDGIFELDSVLIAIKHLSQS
jgi:hypothetical protein